MGSELGLLSLVGSIYEAASQPELWPGLLTDVASLLKCPSGLIGYQDLSGADLSFVEAVGRDPDYWTSYREHYFFVSPFETMLSATKGSSYASEELIEDKTLMRSEFYNDWMRPQNFHYSIGAVLDRGPWGAALVDFQAPHKKGPFPRESRRTISRLAPHLQRAFQLGRAFNTLRVRNTALLDTLDRMDTVVILLNGRGQPVFMNPAAEALLRKAPELSATLRGVSARDPGTDAQLQRLIGQCTATGSGRGDYPGGAVRVWQAGHDLPLIAHVTPLTLGATVAMFEGAGIAAAVFVSRHTAPSVQRARIRAQFGLTEAESRVAAELLEGANAEAIADRLRVGRETVRTQIKAIYSKAGVKRQAQFIALALAGLPARE